MWCDGGAYPRKLFGQLPGGKPTTRCACFKELGWSDLRQVGAVGRGGAGRGVPSGEVQRKRAVKGVGRGRGLRS